MFRRHRGTSVYEVYDEETFLVAEEGTAGPAFQHAVGTGDQPYRRSARSRRWPAGLALAFAAMSVAAVVDDRLDPVARTSTNVPATTAPSALHADVRRAAERATRRRSARASRMRRTARRVHVPDAPRHPTPQPTGRRAHRHPSLRRDVAGATRSALEPGSAQAQGTGRVRPQAGARVAVEFGFEG
jgi:hypothetical protein